MKNSFLALLAFLLLHTLNSCSKKTIPEETHTVSSNNPATAGSTTAATEVMPAKTTKAVSAEEYATGKRKVTGASTPKFIVVNDKSAKSTADGKLYYDLGGYRYWKNNKDGKYYLDGIFSSLSDKPKKKKKTVQNK